MALLHRRKVFSSISRYRLCGRSSFSSSASGTAVSDSAILGIFCTSPFLTQMHSMRKLLPAMEQTSLWLEPRRYRRAASYLEIQQQAPCFCNLGNVLGGPCCSMASSSCIFARNCTTAAYPPPAPTQEFQGADQEAEADGAPLNVDEPEEMAAMDGAEGSNMPPYDDPNMPPYDDQNYPEDDEEYEDEDPPPDPEEKLLYSPSDED